MTKILVIPDLHGRSFWKEPCNNWEGRIVFLGDYHDPYGGYVDGEPDKAESLANLKELVEFVKNKRNTSNIICLLGNHDCHYFNTSDRCRFDYEHNEEVKELISNLSPQLYYIIGDLTPEVTNKYLFSHAGITKDWLEYNNLELKDLDNIDITNFSPLDQIPYSRGGYDLYGSCIWNSVSDYIGAYHLPNYYQIFGHSWSTEPIISKDFAMLDCCKPFVLNTETKQIEEWLL